MRHDLIQVAVRLLERGAFGRDVAVVEAPEGRADFLEEFERRIHSRLCDGDGVATFFPRTHDRAWPERIRAGSAERMPVRNREPQVFGHALAVDDLVRIVVPERESAIAPRA